MYMYSLPNAEAREAATPIGVQMLPLYVCGRRRMPPTRRAPAAVSVSSPIRPLISAGREFGQLQTNVLCVHTPYIIRAGDRVGPCP